MAKFTSKDVIPLPRDIPIAKEGERSKIQIESDVCIVYKFKWLIPFSVFFIISLLIAKRLKEKKQKID